MKKLLLLSILFLSFSTYAELSIHAVVVKCKVSLECDQKTNEFKSLKRSYEGIEQFKKILKLYIANEGVSNLSYVIKRKNNKNELAIQLEMKPEVIELKTIRFLGNESIELPSALPIKENDFLDDYRIEQTKKLIKQVAIDKGYPSAKVKVKTKKENAQARVSISVDLGRPIKALSIVINSNDKYLKDLLYKNISRFKKIALDSQELKDEVELTRQLFLQYGYYLATINIKFKKISTFFILVTKIRIRLLN